MVAITAELTIDLDNALELMRKFQGSTWFLTCTATNHPYVILIRNKEEGEEAVQEFFHYIGTNRYNKHMGASKRVK